MAKLNYGTVLCDMHHGLDLSRLKNASVANEYQLDVSEMMYNRASAFIQELVRSQLRDPEWIYLNKMLVVIGECWREGHLKAAYCYDDRRLVFLDIKCDWD